MPEIIVSDEEFPTEQAVIGRQNIHLRDLYLKKNESEGETDSSFGTNDLSDDPADRLNEEAEARKNGLEEEVDSSPTEKVKKVKMLAIKDHVMKSFSSESDKGQEYD